MIEGLVFGTGALAVSSVISADFSGLGLRMTEVTLLLRRVPDPSLGLGMGFGFGGALVSSRRSKAALRFEVSSDSPPGVNRTLCFFLGGLDPSLEAVLLDSALRSRELSPFPSLETGVRFFSGDAITTALFPLLQTKVCSK